MIEIGKTQLLQIERIVHSGVFLSGGTDDYADDVFLSKEYLPPNAKEGDFVEVFVYKDPQNRWTGTTKTPYAQVGELAYLRVIKFKSFGAFLDLGIGKDLFLPKTEQAYRVEIGRSYLVALFLDEALRLTATTNIYEYLKTDSPYQKNDKIKATAYQIKREMGALVAVDDKYYGLIPEDEYFERLEPGDRIDGRVIRVREDGKLDISMREPAHLQMGADANLIYQAMLDNNGFIPLHDKSDPEEIKRRLRISKKAFKRAVGRLLKERKIIQTDSGLKIK